MKVTLEFDGKSLTVNAQSGFELLVDDEVLLSHDGGEEAGYTKVDAGYADEDKCLDIVRKTCCGGKGCCDDEVGYGQESLWDKDAYHRLQAHLAKIEASEVKNEETKPETTVYHCKAVENSSFITQIRWWNWEESLGVNALEVSLKDGRIFNYGDVPFHVYSAWVKTIVDGGSAGRFFNQAIKNQYEMISEIDENGNLTGYEGDDE